MTTSTAQIAELTGRLSVPEKLSQQLSFSDSSQEAFERYVRRLPLTNPAEVLARLYKALPELAALDAAPHRKVALLDAVAPALLEVIRKTITRLPFTENNRKTYSLCLALFRHMASGYKSIVIQAPANEALQPHTLTRGLYSALLFHSQMLLLCWSAYLPIPTGLWRETHALYQIARRLNLLSQPVRSAASNSQGGDTIENIYLATATLGALDPYGKTSEDLRQLFNFLNRNAEQIQLSGLSRNALFTIDPDADNPPQYTRKLSATPPRALGLDPGNLVALISTDISQVLPPRLQQLIRHHCTSEVMRGNQRDSDSTTVVAVIGLSHIHRLLTRTHSLTNYVDELSTKAPHLHPQSFGGPVLGEEWNADEKRGRFMREIRNNPDNPIEYSGASGSDGVTSGRIQAIKAVRFDRSNQGAGLHFSQGAERLGPGELLAVRAANSEQWRLAISRWARTDRDASRRIGIEYIQGTVTPCAVCLAKSDRNDSPYFPAFMLKDEDKSTLLVPSIPFVRHSRVRVLQPGKQFITQLLTQTESTYHLSCFTFHQ